MIIWWLMLTLYIFGAIGWHIAENDDSIPLASVIVGALTWPLFALVKYLVFGVGGTIFFIQDLVVKR
jgi:hypothetical protein